MKKITVHIADQQYDWLRQRSEQLGVTSAEILRQAIEHYINTINHPVGRAIIRTVDPAYKTGTEERARADEQINDYVYERKTITLGDLDERMRSMEVMLRKLTGEEAMGKRKE